MRMKFLRVIMQRTLDSAVLSGGVVNYAVQRGFNVCDLLESFIVNVQT